MANFQETFATPAPTMVTGMRAVTDMNAVRVKADVSDEIFAYDPNANSLTLLLTKARKKRTVSQYIFHWLEKDRYPRFDSSAETTTAADGTLTVADGTKFYKNAIVLNHRSLERYYVTNVSGNDLSITRQAGAGAKPIVTGDVLEIVGSAYVEGGDLGTSKSVQERNVEQYTQVVRTPFSFTGRDENTDMYGGKDPNGERRWQAVEHAISIEKNFWWGVKRSLVDPGGSGKYVTFMNGIHEYVKDNVWDLNGIPFTERSLTEWLEYAMRYGNGGKMGKRSKFLFVAPRFVTEMEQWGKESKLRYMPEDKVHGLTISAYRSTHGKLFIIEHPLFEEKGDIGFLLDLNHVRYVNHQGRDTKLLEDRGGNGVDGTTEEYLSDVAVQCELSAAHGFIKNLSL